MSTQSKRFCFTLNNYTPEDEVNVKALECAFLVYGHEVAPSTGTPHLQGYIEMHKKTTIKGMTKVLPRTSFQVCKGTADHNITYCQKEGANIFTKGAPAKQGERNDLTNLRNDIMEGRTTVDQIVLDKPDLYHQYGRTLSKIEDLRMRKLFRTETTQGLWYFGPTGVGKSHKAYANYSPDTHYNWKDDNGWQDGYAQQETVIINEFRGSIKFSELLQLVDKWPFDVRRRNREPMPFTSKLVIITSSLPPEQVYKMLDHKDKINQLMRRFTVLQLRLDSQNKCLTEVYNGPQETLPRSEESC